MRSQSHKLAVCAMTAAVGVVIMVLLGLTGVGTYAAPLAAAMLLVPIAREYGVKTALLLWLATGLLSLVLVPDWEQSIVYLTIIGWYPAARPLFERLPGKLLSMAAKLLAFNLACCGSYAVMIPFLGLTEEMYQAWLWIVMLLIGNLVFLMEDRVLIPKTVPALEKRLHGVKKP